MLSHVGSPWQRRLILACCLCLMTLNTLLFAPTSVLAATDVVLYVNNQHSQASNGNSGTSDRPLRTIDAALERAREHRNAGRSTTIRIADGTYRETVSVSLRD